MHVQLFIASISIMHVPALQTGYLYSRWGNPTVDAAADTIARLEGAAGSLLFSSESAYSHADSSKSMRQYHLSFKQLLPGLILMQVTAVGV